MPGPKKKLLIVDDDAEYRATLDRALSAEYVVSHCASSAEARDSLDREISIALVDVRLRQGTGNRDGLDLLESVKQAYPDLPVVMMTAYGDIDLAVEAMKLGAADFIQKARVDVREFRKVLDNALRRVNLERRVANLEDDLRRIEPWDLVGGDSKLEKVREMVDMAAADGYCSVMIRGETGSGKELVARAIHSRGARRDKPFVAVSIPALAPALVSTELFGHAKGAYTDAKEARSGYVEKADGGVLFLDEIGELTHDVQTKLLRFLETKTFARVGSTTEVTTDIQIVCATNRNIDQAIAQEQFRSDLFYRLQSVVIAVPPLRERLEDIPLLVDHFLFLFRQQGRTKLAGIAPATVERLRAYRYPGNVRELRSIVERSMMWADRHRHSLIDLDDLPSEISADQTLTESPLAVALDGEKAIDLDRTLARAELAYIQKALAATEGKKTEAWKILGLNDRFALRRRVKRIADAYPGVLDAFPLVRSLYREHKP